MNYTEDVLNGMKSSILKRVDEIHILCESQNYIPKYIILEEEIKSFTQKKENIDKLDIVNIRELFRRQLNINELKQILSTEELTDVNNAYELSRTRVKILYGLPLN